MNKIYALIDENKDKLEINLYEDFEITEIDYLDQHKTAYIELSRDEWDKLLSYHKVSKPDFINSNSWTNKDLQLIEKGLRTYRTNEIKAKATELFQEYIRNPENNNEFRMLLEKAAVNYIQDNKYIELQAYSESYNAILKQLSKIKKLTIDKLVEGILAEVIHHNAIVTKFAFVPDDFINELKKMSLIDLAKLDVKEEINKRILN